MNGHLMRGLLALYPRAFRDRYGAELASVTDDLISAGELTPLLAVLNLVCGAALEWGRVLFSSRRVVQAMAAAAIVAVAGSLYVTSAARPPSTAASAHSGSALVVTYRSSGRCYSWVGPAGSVATLSRVLAEIQAAAKPGQFAWLSMQTLPLPVGAAHPSPRPGLASSCVLVIKLLPAGWIVRLRSAPGSMSLKSPS
jgi:hypothetical protein